MWGTVIDFLQNIMKKWWWFVNLTISIEQPCLKQWRDIIARITRRKFRKHQCDKRKNKKMFTRSVHPYWRLGLPVLVGSDLLGHFSILHRKFFQCYQTKLKVKADYSVGESKCSFTPNTGSTSFKLLPSHSCTLFLMSRVVFIKKYNYSACQLCAVAQKIKLFKIIDFMQVLSKIAYT